MRRYKKVRGIKRKLRNTVQYIELHTKEIPTSSGGDLASVLLVVPRELLINPNTPLNVKTQVMQACLNGLASLDALLRVENKHRALFTLDIRDFGIPRLAVLEKDTSFAEFAEFFDYLSEEAVQAFQAEWGVIFPSHMQIAKRKPLGYLMSPSLPMNEAYVIGDLR